MEKNKFGVNISAEVERMLLNKQRFLAETVWDVEHWRGDNMLSRTKDHNICTDEGLNHLLNVVFGATAKETTWYVEIYEGSSVPSFVAGTTYAAPTGTPSSAYDEATRPEYIDVAATGKVMTNSASKATFTINASKTIQGASLVAGGSAATTKADVAGGGILYCAAAFSSPKVCEDDDVLKITITITAADN